MVLAPSVISRSAAVLSIKSRVQPSTRYLRFASRPRPSRRRELLPSAQTIRSALALRPFASVSSPSALAATAVEPVTISTPARAAAAASPAMHRDQPIAAVAHLARMCKRRALHRGIVGADRLQHAQAVLVDVNAGASGAQPVGTLMHAHAPAALGQRAGCGQTGKSCASDLGMPLAHRRLLMTACS